MCMCNVNANSFFCKNIQKDNNGYSFHGTFTSVEGIINGEECLLIDCYVVVLANILESTDDNPLDKNIDCKLTLVSKQTGRATRIADFSLEPQNDIVKKNNTHQCKDFSSRRFLVHLENFVLNSSKGDYILKLWMKNKEDTDWKIQSMTLLNVK